MIHNNWFIAWGWIYLPVNFRGYLITFAVIIFMIPVSFAVIRNGHSISDDLYNLFAYFTCVAFCWKWIAQKTSK